MVSNQHVSGDEGRNMINTYGLTHTALPVGDIERSIRFYGSLLGMEVRSRDGDWADLGTPGCNDVLTLQSGTDGIGEMGALGHIGFRLQRPEKLEDLAAAVVEAGGTVDDEGFFTPESPYVFARDPDGYVIELWFEP
jgi:catechol 2,3-dioxygenase-like lactoylglutathione lyase family enzyme